MHDITEGFLALCVSILKDVPPERAFELLENPSASPKKRSDLTEEDTRDMIIFRDEGLTYKEIAEMYGLTDGYVNKRIKWFGQIRNETRC